MHDRRIGAKPWRPLTAGELSQRGRSPGGQAGTRGGLPSPATESERPARVLDPSKGITTGGEGVATAAHELNDITDTLDAQYCSRSTTHLPTQRRHHVVPHFVSGLDQDDLFSYSQQDPRPAKFEKAELLHS